MIEATLLTAIQLGLMATIAVAYIRSRSPTLRADFAIQQELGELEAVLPAVHALAAAEVESLASGATAPEIESLIADHLDRARTPTLARRVAKAVRLVRTGSLDPEMIIATQGHQPADPFAALRTGLGTALIWGLAASTASLLIPIISPGAPWLPTAMTPIIACMGLADLLRRRRALMATGLRLEEAVDDLLADHYLAPIQRALKDQDRHLAEELAEQVTRLGEIVEEQYVQPAQMLRQEKEQIAAGLNRLSSESSKWTKSVSRLASAQRSLATAIRGELSAFSAQLLRQAEQLLEAQQEELIANRGLLEEHVAALTASIFDSFAAATEGTLATVDSMMARTLGQLQSQLPEALGRSAADALLPALEAIQDAQLGTGQLAQATGLLTQDVERYTLATTQWVTGLQHVGPRIDDEVAGVLSRYDEVATLWRSQAEQSLAQWQTMLEKTAQTIVEELANRAAMTTTAAASDGVASAKRPATSKGEPPRALTIEEAETRLRGEVPVTITTTKGQIDLVLRGDLAPKTVAAFIHCAKSGKYDGKAWSRMYRLGALTPYVSGVDGGYLPFEPTSLPAKRGVIASRPSFRNGSFCILKADALSSSCAVFGHVTKGMDVVDELDSRDKILQAVVGE